MHEQNGLVRMRIALVNWSSRKVGGIETYLDMVLSGLADRGNHVALWHEMDRPQNRDRIAVPEGVPTWCVEELGIEKALQRLREWRPHLIYSQGLIDDSIESALPSIAPVFFFAHQYYGTCVGGPKTWKFPRVVPCTRKIGWQCLVHYYPHRCGGWHPRTMLREYRRQIRRIDGLQRCRGIITHTEHMRREYLNHGFSDTQVHMIPFPIVGASTAAPPTVAGNLENKSQFRLLFVGRMDPLKGGHVLIDAAAAAAKSLGRPIHLTLAGDGPHRAAWERKAQQAQDRHAHLTVTFPGWVSTGDRDSLFAESDLLVVPSLWPEPFGMVGIEAALFGVPSAAFAVGGIPDWLCDGRNGHLAPGNPPTAGGLARSIVRCLEDESHYANLRAGAFAESTNYTTAKHLDALLEVFSDSSCQGAET